MLQVTKQFLIHQLTSNKMKTIVYSILISALFFVACNNGTPKNQTADNTDSKNAVEPNKTEASAPSTTELISDYLQIKNALMKDNDKDAAAASNEMIKAFGNFDKASLTAEQSKIFNDIADDAKEMQNILERMRVI